MRYVHKDRTSWKNIPRCLGDDASKVVANLGVVLLVDELGGGLLARDGAREVVADLRVVLLIDGVGRFRTVLT